MRDIRIYFIDGLLEMLLFSSQIVYVNVYLLKLSLKCI
jgi:hypothetical protein